jgi:uncharacterized protein YprB with RNaseH-like and TPR domain
MASSYDPFSRLSALKPVRTRAAVLDTSGYEQCDELMSLTGSEVARNRYGDCLVSRQWYGTPEICDIGVDALRLLLPKASPTSVDHATDATKWLFLDTETTGLCGGTGTYAFLVGLAWWDSGGLQIEQLFMRDHSEEHSVLAEIAQRLRERPVLVTFNGKSFDWPLLETRYRMTRSIAVPSISAHLDFLHPARQLWRLKFKSLRLADLERNILNAESLGWTRQNDIDSSRIPEFYFDYLRGGSPATIAGVFHHNRMDLRGLAALAGRVLCTLTDPEVASAGGALELYGLSRLLNRRGEDQQARTTYERALAAGLPETVDHKARHELALIAKRGKDFDRAIELWSELSRGSATSPQACEQLAIHYEKRVGDHHEAARLTRAAIAELHKSARHGFIAPSRTAGLLMQFQHRLARLERKISAKRDLSKGVRFSHGAV